MKIAIALVLAAGVAHADCPAAVKTAVAKKFPAAKIEACKDEGKQWEVRLTTKVELDVTADGKILQVEEPVALADVPAAVTKAFAAKYPKAKAKRAEKQTHADDKVFYELAFDDKEVTFAADGTFVEEEHAD